MEASNEQSNDNEPKCNGGSNATKEVKKEANNDADQTNNVNNHDNNNNENTNSANSSNSSSQNASDEAICRDYLRNVCRRKNCRFKHPDQSSQPTQHEPETVASCKENVKPVFCHDFQNRQCKRENCKFLHCSKAEEEIYRSTGRLPTYLDPSIPICKDYSNGTCRRGARCRYRHVNERGQCNHTPSDNAPKAVNLSAPAIGSMRADYYHNAPQPQLAPDPLRANTVLVNPVPTPSHGTKRSFAHTEVNYGYAQANGYHSPMPVLSPMRSAAPIGGVAYPPSRYDYGPDIIEGIETKRKRYLDYNGDIYAGFTNGTPPQPPPPPQPSLQPTIYAAATSVAGATQYTARQAIHTTSGAAAAAAAAAAATSYMLEDENASLRRRIDELKKQVQDMVATNEYLLDQLRVSQNAAGQSAAAVAAVAAAATSVASLAQTQAPGVVSSAAAAITNQLTQSLALTPVAVVPPPQQSAQQAVQQAVMPLPPSSIVSSMAAASIPMSTASVTGLVNSSGAVVSFTPTLHATTSWPMGVDP